MSHLYMGAGTCLTGQLAGGRNAPWGNASIYRTAHANHSHLGAIHDSPIGFMCIFLECGRKQKYLEKLIKTKGEHAISTQ